jgi:hypothetical protein
MEHPAMSEEINNVIHVADFGVTPSNPDCTAALNEALSVGNPPAPLICAAHPNLRFMKGYALGYQEHLCYDDEPERVVAIAIKMMRNRQPYYYIGYMPGRQHNLVRAIADDMGQSYIPPDVSSHGFLTSRGRFVQRPEARRIAEEQGQLLKGASLSNELYSEDLW